jgi:hypothetical protein
VRLPKPRARTTFSPFGARLRNAPATSWGTGLDSYTTESIPATERDCKSRACDAAPNDDRAL